MLNTVVPPFMRLLNFAMGTPPIVTSSLSVFAYFIFRRYFFFLSAQQVYLGVNPV